MPDTDTSPFLTVPEVAELAGLKVRTLYVWVELGRTPKPSQPGGRRGKMFWRREVIEEWIAAGMPEAEE